MSHQVITSNTVFKRGLFLSNMLYPNITGVDKIRKKFRLYCWCILSPKVTNELMGYFDDPLLKKLITVHPSFIEKPLKPYGCLSWDKNQRTLILKKHLQFMLNNFSSNLLNIYQHKGYKLWQITDKNGNTYNIYLDAGYSREGSIGITLTDNNDTQLYCISFTVNQEQSLLHIGALQGPDSDIENRQELIKQLTKGLYGLRPKALMVELVLIFADCYQLKSITAVSNKGHIYQALRYIGSKRTAVSCDYDELWQEYYGIKQNKELYQLPLSPKRKDLTLLNRNKRKLYKHRYQWLNELKPSLQLALQSSK
ncbi:VirK/YbjX family protein [Photobacterium leiognathi]|uniref:VirK/YbjX family protein n=1 Tax=Photobacterium leiognathi TaxID=553611 RepID=UPI002980CEC2|nr:VirK/YbjX family protein [Photobacterium leiognathi]